MLRSLTRFVLPALLLTLLSSSANAADKVDNATLEKIHKQLRDIDGQLKLIRPEELSLALKMAASDIGALQKQVAALELHVRGQDGGPRVAAAYDPATGNGELAELRRRLADVESRLRVCEAAEGRVARSFSPSFASGAITLQNRTGLAATIVVDGAPYALAPFQVLTLPSRTVGPLTYEVFAEGWGRIQPPTTRLLAADRPFTIFVNP